MSPAAGSRGERALRPFWMHQLAEYLLGLALVAQGLQGPQPLLPALAGALLVVNAAVTRGPLSAFSLVGRRTHRVIDVVVLALVVLAAVQPWVEVDAGSRLVLGAIAAVYAFLWWYTDFAERATRRERRAAAAGDRGEEWGRTAGRLAGGVVSGWRQRQDRRSPD